MDPVSQIALGGAIGQAVLGPKVGYRAALWGGICGTIPDLDIFIPMGGAVADFTYHRSFSHSLLILPLIAPLLVWLILKIHPQTNAFKKQWYWLVLLALLTHPILDALTIYGTQLLWPVTNYPFGTGSVFVIDPLYTLPLLIGVIIALTLRNRIKAGQTINAIGLALSSLYLAWGLGAQLYVKNIATDYLALKTEQQKTLIIAPTPFNSFLWRILKMTDTGYKEGLYSVFDKTKTIEFIDHISDKTLLTGLESHWPVQRIKWFSKGFYKVEQKNNLVIMTDLRMGFKNYYAFSFKVGETANPHSIPAKDERIPTKPNWNQIAGIFKRIWQ